MPTAKCIRDTKERQLVTRSGLQGLRLRVRHLHHKQAMTAPATVRQFFGTVHHFKVDVIAGDANAAVYKYYKIQEYQDLHNSSVVVMLREMHVRSTLNANFQADFTLIIVPIIILLSFAQQVILIVASWLLSHGENLLDPGL